MYIRPGTTNVLEPSGDCTRWISVKFHERLDSAPSYGKVSAAQKDSYFQEFGKEFDWDPREEAAIRNAWSKKAAKSYAHITYRARKSGKRPEFILDDVWQEWAPRWEDPKWKEKSEKMKANRDKATTHTGAPKLKLKVDDVPAHTLFQQNHSVGYDMSTWVSAKAFTVEEAYKRELEVEKANGATIDDNALYYKAVGGTKRGEVYGTGATKEFYYDSSSGSSVCSGRSRSTSKWTSCGKRSSYNKRASENEIGNGTIQRLVREDRGSNGYRLARKYKDTPDSRPATATRGRRGGRK